jgi:hypothetical protein
MAMDGWGAGAMAQQRQTAAYLGMVRRWRAAA